MADALTDRMAQVLFGTTNVSEITPKNFGFRICRINMIAPGNLACYAPGVVVTVKIETTCCEYAHVIQLLDSSNRVVGSCTPVITCASGTTGNGSGSCDITMPATEGFYTLEVVIGSQHQTGSIVEVRRTGFFACLKRLFNM